MAAAASLPGRAPVALSILTGIALAVGPVHPARAQVDTVETWAGTLGRPRLAEVVIGDLAPPYGSKHIVYTRDGQLRHAWKDVGPWQIEDVGDDANSHDVAVAGDGRVTIAYSSSDGRLMCASRNSSGWDFDTVATFPGAQLLISLELHPEPAMAIVVSTGGGTSLWYARRSAGQWTVDDLGSPAVAWPPSLAFDGGDRPHIAFVHPAATLNGTEVAMLNGASAAGPFALAVVDTSGHGPCALAWDRVRDRPRLAYGARLRDPTWGTLEEQYRYAYAGVDGAWHYTLVSEVIGPATNPLSLALDPWGSPGVGWTRVSAIGPTGIDRVQSCGFVETGAALLSRQLPAAPDSPFQPTQVGPHSYLDAVVGYRGVASGLTGTFGICWREPRITCAPYQVLYTEVPSEQAGVPQSSEGKELALAIGPNPISGDAAIRMSWSQPREARASFELHDLAGRIRSRLETGVFAPGSHTWSWRPGSLAPGVYWLSLRLDGGDRISRVLIAR